MAGFVKMPSGRCWAVAGYYWREVVRSVAAALPAGSRVSDLVTQSINMGIHWLDFGESPECVEPFAAALTLVLPELSTEVRDGVPIPVKTTAENLLTVLHGGPSSGMPAEFDQELDGKGTHQEPEHDRE